MINRRQMIAGSAVAFAAIVTGCAETDGDAAPGSHSATTDVPGTRNAGRWLMPAEETPHEATWMCWPSSTAVWGSDLPAVQDTIAALALAVSEFEPVKILARPSETVRLRTLVEGADVEVIEGPVDDLWARDTLPCFLIATSSSDDQPLVAGRVRFNGWGNKQIHEGDARLATLVAESLGITLMESGLTGEGGGVEVDGEGTVLAARSSWVNDNRNPGVSESDVGRLLVDLLGARRILWVDGVAGEDITDCHIDTIARFADSSTIVVDQPSYTEPGETWYDVSVATRKALTGLTDLGGRPFMFEPLVQPSSPRGTGDSFLSSYVNYYVCNGAVIAPEFGDAAADEAAAVVLRRLYPGRTIVQLNIDPVAAGGGGIHCATQQQPATA